MPNIDITRANVFRPEIWSKEFIRAVRAKLVLAERVWRFDQDVAKDGKTAHVPSISRFVANTKVPGVEVSPQANTETNVDILLDQHKEVSFVVEDMAKVQSRQDLMAHYNDEASFAIVKDIDSSIAALASGLSQTFGTYNTAITTDVVLDSIEQLDNNDVPEEDRYFCFRPDVKRDLLDISTYTSRDFTDGSPVRTGSIGDLYGVETSMSTNLVKSGNNTNNILFHKHAFALAMQIDPRLQSEYVLKELGWLTVCDTLYGVKEMRDTFGVLVKT